MRGRHGISAIVATVLIILITIAAIGIIWGFVIPMINQNLYTEDLDVDLRIDTSGGYTVWDENTGFATVQVKRGADDLNISSAQILFSCAGSSHSFIVPAPGYNQVNTEKFELGVDCDLDTVSVAPVLGVLSKSEVGPVSSKTRDFAKGNVVIFTGDTYFGSDNSVHNVECIGDGDCSGGTSYCFEEECVECLDTSHCIDANECTQDVCLGQVCSNPFEAAEFLCDSGNGECDGAGNCGVCSDVSNPCLQLECKEEILCTAGSCVEQGNLTLGASCASGNGVCDGLGSCVVTENFCLWDYSGDCDNAKGTSLCVYGYTMPGVGSVAIGGELEIVSMEFAMWQTCSDSFELFVNGQSIGSFGAFSTSCLCTPIVTQWPGTFVVDGSLVNDYWNFGGTNTISFDPSGFAAVSSINVDITYTSVY